MIEFVNFSFAYNEGNIQALRNINLSINQGEFVLITGLSGGGKTSLCKCLNGLIPHFFGGNVSGSISVNNFNTLSTSTLNLSQIVGMVFQNPENQFVSLTVESEIAFGLENLNLDESEIDSRISKALISLNIVHLRNSLISNLSGGEKQKIALASILAMQCKIIVLDEPSSELDQQSALELFQLLKKLNEELGLTIILVEHRLDKAIQFVQRIILLHDSFIVLDSPTRIALKSLKFSELNISLPPIVELCKSLGTEIALNLDEAKQFLSPFFSNPDNLLDELYSMEKPIISVENLSFSFGKSKIFDNINLSIFEGEFVAIVGSNGSGKTTLLKHFNGLLSPDFGSVLIRGINTKNFDVSSLSRFCGMVFQNPELNLFEDSVEKEISFSLKNFNFSPDEISQKTLLILRQFNLFDKRFSHPRSLSGGEKQRLAIASIAVFEPKILVLDEPTIGLDSSFKNFLMNFLNDYRKTGKTVVLVTHDIELLLDFVDRVVVLGNKGIVLDDSRRKALSSSLISNTQINALMKFFSLNNDSNILSLNEALNVRK